MKRSRVILAAVACIAPAAVLANSTDDLGKLKIGNSYNYAFASTKPPASFADFVDFDLKANSAVTDTIFGFGVKGLSVQLQDFVAGSWVNIGGASSLPSQTFDLTKGIDYRFDITGKTRGPKGSSSLILGQLAIAAVPEPGTLAMALVGIAALAIHWRRRNRRDRAASSTLGLA
jgi:hypothetical protein